MRPEDRVPLSRRIAWGFGGVADNFAMNAINALCLLIYVTYFKMPPELAGIALFIPRLFDAISDPLAGNLSDNTKSRWGRRRPYMFFGALLSGLLLPFFWLLPGLSSVEETVWYRNIPFLYVTALITFHQAVAYTLFVVPYTALGFEMTNDYDERTRVISWRMYIGLLASMSTPWFYWLCQWRGPATQGLDAGVAAWLEGLGRRMSSLADSHLLRGFPNEGVGAFWVCVLVGVIVIVTGLIPTFMCRERLDVQSQKTIPIVAAFRETFANGPFRILFVAYVIIITGLFTSGGLVNFVTIYHVFSGNKELAGWLGGICGTVGALTSYASMFLIAHVSRRWNKREAMLAGIGFALAGAIGSWFALSPGLGYWMIATTFVSCLGLQGCWLMVDSMTADICDADELHTGLRREGMFGAVKGFALKVALSVTSLFGGYMLKLSGFDQKTADSAGLPHAVGVTMKGMVVGFQVVAFVAAIAILLWYPISRARAAETRRLLDERRRVRPSVP